MYILDTYTACIVGRENNTARNFNLVNINSIESILKPNPSSIGTFCSRTPLYTRETWPPAAREADLISAR